MAAGYYQQKTRTQLLQLNTQLRISQTLFALFKFKTNQIISSTLIQN